MNASENVRLRIGLSKYQTFTGQLQQDLIRCQSELAEHKGKFSHRQSDLAKQKDEMDAYKVKHKDEMDACQQEVVAKRYKPARFSRVCSTKTKGELVDELVESKGELVDIQSVLEHDESSPGVTKRNKPARFSRVRSPNK